MRPHHLRKTLQHIHEAGAKEHDWVHTGGFDSGKYFPQIWNAVFFT